MKSLPFIIAGTICCSVALAQSVQHGVVMEYKGTEAKTALANVSIAVRNAQRTMSDSEGRFRLDFRTLQAGDKVEVREIERDGYVIFNRDAIDEWRIAKGDALFTIVLCDKTRFSELKAQYFAIASQSYEKRRVAEEGALAEKMLNGQLQRDQYERQLRDLRNQYEEQLENLDNYIERFARIDLSELDEGEQKIIRMVQAGDIDGAIKAYDEMGLMDQMERLALQGDDVKTAISALEQKQREIEAQEARLYDMVRNQINLLGMAGGRENFDRIARLHEQSARQLCNNPRVVQECAVFFYNQREFDKAIDWFVTYLNIHTISLSQRIYGAKTLADTQYKKGLVDEALANNQLALDLLANVPDPKGEEELIVEAGALCTRGVILHHKGQLEESESYYLRAMALADSMLQMGMEHKDLPRSRFSVLTNLVSLYISQGRFAEALPKTRIMESDCLRNLRPTDDQSQMDYAYSLGQKGLVFMQMGQLDSAAVVQEAALEHWRPLYKKNPQGYAIYYANVLNNLFILHFYTQEYDKAEQLQQEAIQLRQDQLSDGTDESKLLYAQQLNNMGFLNYTRGQWDKALTDFLQAQAIQEELCQRQYEAYIQELNRTRINIVQVYLCQKRYAECEALDGQCLSEAEALYAKYGEGYLPTYLYAQCNHGELLLAQGKTKQALEIWQRVNQLMPNYVEQNPGTTFPAALKEKGVIK